MKRFEWQQRIQRLDPEQDYHEIFRITATHEFPWDMNQALSFALYRTFAVPSIGHLLYETGEFTQRIHPAGAEEIRRHRAHPRRGPRARFLQ